MYEDSKILAIIPARGGSKRLPNKNILPLQGKPLIEWSLEEAQKSKYIDTTIVSSDSKSILDVVSKFAPNMAFKRPSELAQDETRSIDVVINALEFYKEYEYVILLQPTSPLRDVKDIDGAIEHFFKNKATSVIGVCEVEHSPLWSNTLDETLSMDEFLDDKYNNSRSQDLPLYYRINGAFYMSNTESIKENETFFVKQNIYAYIMSQEHSADIDTKLDFIVADALLRERKLEKNR
ncbi:acylneuraminate cytidylyltransferase family protein [Sulfurimonas aquatica]|uniref:Acylneuraminate cytidylyltransferase family protein n=1 Tax=Sulfurimonas aquatica TaxID=2672570 RepID=A0A975AY82_9BACT|nr:acylneuraminate cytidylyltransferase family protein [Sulfurimonas aquatica]QSZ40739.1 acylneuraminate cytidylyltransferase family protein [Sulfurimonas aquatica]